MSHRRSLLAKIHIGKKALGLDDDAYKDMLQGRYGARSASKLSDAQLSNLVGYMRSQGVEYRRPKKPSGKPRSTAGYYEIPDGTPFVEQKRYFLALWNKLGWNPKGIDKYCKNRFAVEKFIWLNDQDDLQELGKYVVACCRKRGIPTGPTPAPRQAQ